MCWVGADLQWDWGSPAFIPWNPLYFPNYLCRHQSFKCTGFTNMVEDLQYKTKGPHPQKQPLLISCALLFIPKNFWSRILKCFICSFSLVFWLHPIIIKITHSVYHPPYISLIYFCNFNRYLIPFLKTMVLVKNGQTCREFLYEFESNWHRIWGSKISAAPDRILQHLKLGRKHKDCVEVGKGREASGYRRGNEVMCSLEADYAYFKGVLT